eukprot:6722411-Prymnesium_polylepis.2
MQRTAVGGKMQPVILNHSMSAAAAAPMPTAGEKAAVASELRTALMVEHPSVPSRSPLGFGGAAAVKKMIVDAIMGATISDRPNACCRASIAANERTTPRPATIPSAIFSVESAPPPKPPRSDISCCCGRARSKRRSFGRMDGRTSAEAAGVLASSRMTQRSMVAQRSEREERRAARSELDE